LVGGVGGGWGERELSETCARKRHDASDAKEFQVLA
jgi:hypothetical protein